MRFEPTYKFWVVTDPGPNSELADCLYQASLHNLYLQVKGGMTIDEHPKLFTDEEEARREAGQRLWARELTAAVRDAPNVVSVETVRRLRLLDAAGKIVLDIDVLPVGEPGSVRKAGKV